MQEQRAEVREPRLPEPATRFDQIPETDIDPYGRPIEGEEVTDTNGQLHTDPPP